MNCETAPNTLVAHINAVLILSVIKIGIPDHVRIEGLPTTAAERIPISTHYSPVFNNWQLGQSRTGHVTRSRDTWSRDPVIPYME